MKKNLLSQCRFYKGESSFPANFSSVKRASLFWKAERLWVEASGRAPHSSMLFLVNSGLSDEHLFLAQKPAEFLNVPLDLRAFLFECLCHYSDASPEENAAFFLDVVLPEYLA